MKHSKYVTIQNVGERPVMIGWNNTKQEIVITPKVRMSESISKHGMVWRVHALLDREIIEEYRRNEDKVWRVQTSVPPVK